MNYDRFYKLILKNAFNKIFILRQILLTALYQKWIISNPVYDYFHEKRITSCLKNEFIPVPFVDIELTNSCNADCEMCVRNLISRPIEVMGDQLFCKIVDDLIAINVRSINLTGFGEGLLDIQIAHKIALAKQKGIEFITMYTNGSLLDKNKRRELIASGLDQIIFSIDALDKEEYERIRNLKYETVINNLESLISFKRKNNLTKPRIGINTVIYQKRSYKDALEIHKKYKDKVDFLEIHACHDWLSQNSVVESKKKKDFIKKYLRKYPCPHLWYYSSIRVNGDVSPCCQDYNGKNVLGNINKQHFKDIWYGDKLRLMRDKHLTGRAANISMCCDCLIYPNWWIPK